MSWEVVAPRPLRTLEGMGPRASLKKVVAILARGVEEERQLAQKGLRAGMSE
jgi:hypothetical protein